MNWPWSIFKKRSAPIQAMSGIVEGEARRTLRPVNRSDIEIYNNYKSYDQMVAAIWLKFKSLADYGCRMVRTLINYRQSWILSKDITVSVEGEREQVWLKDFLERNEWMKGYLAAIGSMSEVQGHVLIVLMVVEEDGIRRIKTVIFPWLLYKYLPIKSWDGTIAALKYSINMQDQILTPDRFELIVTHGTLDDIQPNGIFTTPKIGNVLQQIDDIDRCAANIRKVNALMARPTPSFSFESEQTSDSFREWLDDRQWEIGLSVVLPERGQMSMVQASMEGVRSLHDEKMRLTQEVSGSLGVPIFLIGFPELVGGGRATASEYREAIAVQTSTERAAFDAGLESLLRKAMILHNKMNNDFLDASTIRVELPEVSLAMVEAQMAIFDKMRDRGDVSLKTYLEQNPYIKDVDQEMKRIDEEKKSGMDAVSSRFDQIMANAGEQKPNQPPPPPQNNDQKQKQEAKA